MDDPRQKADPQAAAALAAQVAKGPRAKVTFRDQDRVCAEDPREVVLRPLALSEELDAARTADADGGPAGDVRLVEQIKRAIVSVDGKVPDATRAEADRLLERMSPRCRQMLQVAYARAFLMSGDPTDFFREQVALEA